MKSNRRRFLQYSGITGAGLALENIMKSFSTMAGKPVDLLNDRSDKAHFNMCGYAAPKLDTVRIGFIGLGNRGPAAVARMGHIEGVEIKALCDIRSEKV